jgi:hypothetical protein
MTKISEILALAILFARLATAIPTSSNSGDVIDGDGTNLAIVCRLD